MFIWVFDVKTRCLTGNNVAANDEAFYAVAVLQAVHPRILGHNFECSTVHRQPSRGEESRAVNQAAWGLVGSRACVPAPPIRTWFPLAELSSVDGSIRRGVPVLNGDYFRR
jgi:hypothetical protein